MTISCNAMLSNFAWTIKLGGNPKINIGRFFDDSPVLMAHFLKVFDEEWRLDEYLMSFYLS